MSALTVRRSLAAAVVLVGLLALAACTGDESEKGRSSKVPATPASPDQPTPTDAVPTGEDDLASLPLDENAPNLTSNPLWAFPVAIDGWEWSTRDDSGLNQLERNGGDVLFTSYQLQESDSLGNDDRSDSRSWLEKYLVKIGSEAGVVDVGSPSYGTVEIDSDHGSIEFLTQDVTYETSAGTTYTSRFAARSLGRYMMAVQYAAPEGEWSEAEWRELISSGLMVTLTP